MDEKELQDYSPKQQRMLEFLAAYLEIDTAELERRIVAMELEALEGVLGMYVDAKETPPKQKGKARLATVADLPTLGGGLDAS